MVAKSWQLSEISAIPQGQSRGKKQYLHCYRVLGTQPEECVRIFPISLPFWPFEPDSWLQFNSCNNTAYYGRDIRHSAISLYSSQNRCFLFSVSFWKKYARPHRRRYLGSVDFVPGTPGALLLDFHNCHYCTPQELDPTRAVHKVWMVALYGTLEQPCGNQMCTVLIFRRNIKACQTIRNNGADLFLNFLIHSFG